MCYQNLPNKFSELPNLEVLNLKITNTDIDGYIDNYAKFLNVFKCAKLKSFNIDGAMVVDNIKNPKALSLYYALNYDNTYARSVSIGEELPDDFFTHFKDIEWLSLEYSEKLEKKLPKSFFELKKLKTLIVGKTIGLNKEMLSEILSKMPQLENFKIFYGETEGRRTYELTYEGWEIIILKNKMLNQRYRFLTDMAKPENRNMQNNNFQTLLNYIIKSGSRDSYDSGIRWVGRVDILARERFYVWAKIPIDKKLDLLDLSGRNLTYLPNELTKINPKILHLQNNNFKEFPKIVCELKGLEELNLENCGLENLPNEFINLQELKVLNLKNNNFKECPKVLDKMKIKNLMI